MHSSPEFSLKEIVSCRNSGAGKFAAINHFYPKAKQFGRTFALTSEKRYLSPNGIRGKAGWSLSMPSCSLCVRS